MERITGRTDVVHLVSEGGAACTFLDSGRGVSGRTKPSIKNTPHNSAVAALGCYCVPAVKATAVERAIGFAGCTARASRRAEGSRGTRRVRMGVNWLRSDKRVSTQRQRLRVFVCGAQGGHEWWWTSACELWGFGRVGAPSLLPLPESAACRSLAPPSIPCLAPCFTLPKTAVC